MDTRLRILQEAGTLFSKFGIRSITMDSIATELGVSKRTLYEIFKDKDDLVFQTITEGLKRHKIVCQTKISKSSNVVEAIFSIIKLNSETFGKLNPLFIQDLKKYHSKIFSDLSEKGEIRDYKITSKLIRRGISETLIRSDINVDIVNVFFHKIMDLSHSEEMNMFTKRDLAESILLPYLTGIATEKGRSLIEEYMRNFNM